MGNTVGSLEVPIMLRARKNLCLSLEERQRDILIGCTIGDAYISPKGNIRIEQSIKQIDYVLWKYEELKSLAYPALPKQINRFNSKRNKLYCSVYFELRRYFRSWRSIFYQDGKKIFPKNLMLSPLSLAVWYMDDGCWTGSKVVISTEGFGDESEKRIQQTLHSQWNIETVIGKNRKLVIRKNSHDQFYGLIYPYITSSMHYKIPNPVTTSRLRRLSKVS